MWRSIASNLYEGYVKDGDVVLFFPYNGDPSKISSPDYSKPKGFRINGWGGRKWQSILEEMSRLGVNVTETPILYRKFSDDATQTTSGFYVVKGGFLGAAPSPPTPQEIMRMRFPGNAEYAKPLSLP
jgi:hypothetical protein